MTWLRHFHAQFLLSQRVYWRDIGFALTAVLVPLGLALAYPISQHRKGTLFGFDAGVFLLPGFIAFTLFWIVYNVINSAAARRDGLIYKRLRGTPLSDMAILTGEAVSGTVVSVIQIAVLVTVGLVVLDSPVPSNVPLLILAVLLGAMMFAVIAIGFSGLLPSAEASTWIVTPVIALMAAGSGVFAPLSSLPDFLQTPAQFLPSTAVAAIVRTAYLGLDFASDPAGTAIPQQVDFLGSLHACAEPLGVMCAWIGIGFGMAQQFFRWDPRHK
ncbi:hypothetical protein Ssi03_48800 [Sphaerisporangium siamense]|uniref:Transport permease protein n=1 Tax=Sphaerisporangium siamense TaxID=795645 RepID=A0A7W7D3F5_9ACTN|nr:ABC transporter permease [Sphaerisporangium siamense]MBB4699477.1 ABC-2 type transport system permease protein [Sphaerisporangium siamense]GII86890.1 hypothetical protein Ssi03_48800 [Sphaerisporangium siamense]